MSLASLTPREKLDEAAKLPKLENKLQELGFRLVDGTVEGRHWFAVVNQGVQGRYTLELAGPDGEPSELPKQPAAVRFLWWAKVFNPTDRSATISDVAKHAQLLDELVAPMFVIGPRYEGQQCIPRLLR